MKTTQNNPLTLSIIAILAVAGVSIFALGRNSNESGNNSMGSMMNTSDNVVGVDRNSADYKSYSMINGEDYDRMYLANMISHHEGAVDMANAALRYAGHQEIKTLAQAIISSQSVEIANMKAWQTTWGFPVSSGEMMMDHSAMGMMDMNGSMMQSLNGKTGDAFDKAFLEQMIIHHQSAVNMSTPGQTNAKHQELKDLTVAIVKAQTAEIVQMKQWQKDWKY
jgi:uncharacterized protein (DUF305 family)